MASYDVKRRRSQTKKLGKGSSNFIGVRRRNSISFNPVMQKIKTATVKKAAQSKTKTTKYINEADEDCI